MTTATARAATIRLSPRLNGALNTQAKAMNISKASLIRQALLEKLEDIQDLTEAKAVMVDIRKGKRETVPLEELLKQHGV